MLKMTSCCAQPSVQTNNTQILVAAASAEMRQNVRLAGLQPAKLQAPTRRPVERCSSVADNRAQNSIYLCNFLLQEAELIECQKICVFVWEQTILVGLLQKCFLLLPVKILFNIATTNCC